MVNIELFKATLYTAKYSELSEPEIYEYPEGITNGEKELYLEYYSDIKHYGIKWAEEQLLNFSD